MLVLVCLFLRLLQSLLLLLLLLQHLLRVSVSPQSCRVSCGFYYISLPSSFRCVYTAITLLLFRCMYTPICGPADTIYMRGRGVGGPQLPPAATDLSYLSFGGPRSAFIKLCAPSPSRCNRLCQTVSAAATAAAAAAAALATAATVAAAVAAVVGVLSNGCSGVALVFLCMHEGLSAVFCILLLCCCCCCCFCCCCTVYVHPNSSLLSYILLRRFAAAPSRDGDKPLVFRTC